MATFRVEKSKDYTVMSNHHLRNADLSLKAKGLLSQLLSFLCDRSCILHRCNVRMEDLPGRRQRPGIRQG